MAQPPPQSGNIRLSFEELDKMLSGGAIHYVTDVYGNAWKTTMNTICSACNAGYGRNPPPPGPLKVCSGCKNAFYCNKACQKEHWKRKHKAECKMLRDTRKEERTESGWKK